jgi:hypothetical protein
MLTPIEAWKVETRMNSNKHLGFSIIQLQLTPGDLGLISLPMGKSGRQ